MTVGPIKRVGTALDGGASQIMGQGDATRVRDTMLLGYSWALIDSPPGERRDLNHAHLLNGTDPDRAPSFDSCSGSYTRQHTEAFTNNIY